jgi:diguanylate cyclase (GGDEF)-like protein
MARTDGLTGLANRTTFIERLRHAFAAAQRGAIPFAIFYLDLDYFKPVNDTLGHPIGDMLLQQVAERLKSCTRDGDLVARLGGDEFAVLQAVMGEATNAAELADRLRVAVAAPYRLNGNDVRISASIGVCPYVQGSSGADAMLMQADLALYRSKQEGRNQYHFHSEELDRKVIESAALAHDLRAAIERGELEVQYQPQIELSTGNIVGMEALVRWNHPTRGLLSPGLFIPIAERTGSIMALGHWVLDQACRQLRLWRDGGLALPMIAVNLSLFQLRTGEGLVQEVADVVAKWGLLPRDVEFDVTEATLAHLTWAQNDVLPQLRQLGVRIAIDNFGSEYSSFEYIRAYRVNHLKIAQSFIGRSTDDPESAATIRAIVNFARDVGVGIIAQGVETEQQRELVASTGSTAQAQGFHFSRALGAANATEFLRRGGLAPMLPDGDIGDDAPLVPEPARVSART